MAVATGLAAAEPIAEAELASVAAECDEYLLTSRPAGLEERARGTLQAQRVVGWGVASPALRGMGGDAECWLDRLAERVAPVPLANQGLQRRDHLLLAIRLLLALDSFVAGRPQPRRKGNRWEELAKNK